MRRVNISTPAYGGRYAGAYVRTLYRLLSGAAGQKLSFSHTDIDYADIVTARNFLISNFYQLARKAGVQAGDG